MKEKQKTVLAVDDDSIMIKLLERRLSAQNYHVLTALNGETGLQMAIDHHPDLILLDVMMPDLSGPEVVKRLQQDESTKDIPIIFISVVLDKGKDKLQTQIEVEGQQYSAFAKPLHFPKLLSVMKKTLRKQE